MINALLCLTLVDLVCSSTFHESRWRRAIRDIDAPWQIDHQVLCEGSLPSRWRLVQYWDKRGKLITEPYSTPREFCALHHYGGKATYNRGAWWSPEFNRISVGGDLPIDLVSSSLPITLADNIFCTLRCKAVPHSADATGDRLRRETAQAIKQSENPATSPDKYSFFDANLFTHQTNEILLVGSAESHPRSDSEQSAYRIDRIGPPTQYDPILRCRGSLPPRPWPPPFNALSTEDMAEDSPNRPFKDITALCAAFWFGGDPRGNTGMVCHKDRHGHVNLRMESYLAHPALYRKNPRGGTFIDLWCHRACDCPVSQEDRNAPLSNELSYSAVAHRGEGKVIFRASGTILVALQDAATKGHNYCRVAPYSEVVGGSHKSSSLPNCQSDVLDPLEGDPNVGLGRHDKCGQSCTGPHDCNQAGSCSSCVVQPRLLSSMPVAAAVCLTLSRSSALLRING